MFQGDVGNFRGKSGDILKSFGVEIGLNGDVNLQCGHVGSPLLCSQGVKLGQKSPWE